MNISPEELDYLLISHPSLADVSVTGYDDELYTRECLGHFGSFTDIKIKDMKNLKPVTPEEVMKNSNKNKKNGINN